jgi:hypothetical protein
MFISSSWAIYGTSAIFSTDHRMDALRASYQRYRQGDPERDSAGLVSRDGGALSLSCVKVKYPRYELLMAVMHVMAGK